MVAELADEDMEMLMLPPSVLDDFAMFDFDTRCALDSHEYSAVKLSMRLRGEVSSHEEPPVKKPKGRRSVTEERDEARAERDEARAEIRLLKAAAGAAHGASITKLEALRNDSAQAMKQRARADREVKVARADAAAVKEERDAANMRIHELTKSIKRQKVAVARLNSDLTARAGQLSKQTEITWRLREEKAKLVSSERFEEENAKYQEQLAVRLQLEDDRDAAEVERDEMNERLGALQQELADATDGARIDFRRSDVRAVGYLRTLKVEVGILMKYSTVPARACPSDDTSRDWRKHSVRHIAAVLDKRGEGEDINVVADALHRAGYLQRLHEARRFQVIARSMVHLCLSSHPSLRQPKQ